MSRFKENVYFVVTRIPYGKVVSYGQVALYAGLPRAARQVGWILNQSEGVVDLLWWRVINNGGKITIKGSQFNTPDTQRKLLLSENVFVSENLDIAIEEYRWIPSDKVNEEFENRAKGVKNLSRDLPINSSPKRN